MSNSNPLKLLYTTLPSEEQAIKVAHHLLEKKVIACANLFPAHRSLYHWKGNIQSESEVILLVKTSREKAQIAQKELEDIHPYEVPCILEIDCVANAPYFQWVQQEVE